MLINSQRRPQQAKNESDFTMAFVEHRRVRASVQACKIVESV